MREFVQRRSQRRRHLRLFVVLVQAAPGIYSLLENAEDLRRLTPTCCGAPAVAARNATVVVSPAGGPAAVRLARGIKRHEERPIAVRSRIGHARLFRPVLLTGCRASSTYRKQERAKREESNDINSFYSHMYSLKYSTSSSLALAVSDSCHVHLGLPGHCISPLRTRSLILLGLSAIIMPIASACSYPEASH